MPSLCTLYIYKVYTEMWSKIVCLFYFFKANEEHLSGAYKTAVCVQINVSGQLDHKKSFLFSLNRTRSVSGAAKDT